MIPFAGVQEDEALFGVPLFLFKQRELSLNIFHRELPLMVMSYVGTLKTLLYYYIFRIAGVTVWSVRLPMVLAGALTVFVLYKFTTQAAGAFAGLCAAFLLATDPTFLVTNTFDWGPVALGHLLVVTGCFFLLRFGQEHHKMRDLAQGFFFLGLALWNKALMFWILGGLTLGGLVFWREIRRVLTFRTAGIATAAFLLGALPFVIFNVKRHNATLGENFRLEPATVSQIVLGKGRMVQMSLNGSGLLGFIPAAESEYTRPAVTRRGRVAQWIERHLGEHRTTGFDWMFLAALACVPLWWRKSGAWFALIFMFVTWLGMAITAGAGGAVHHSVLLWPFPAFFVAIVLASLPWRRVATVAVVAMVVMNLLVVNQYLADFDRNGANGNFTDAAFQLYKAFPKNRKPIYVTDWGMANTLAMFTRGRLDIRSALGLFQPEKPSDTDWEIIKRVMTDPDATFVGHVDGRENFQGVNEHFNRAAAAFGRKKQTIESISDSHGRPVYEIFRMVGD